MMLLKPSDQRTPAERVRDSYAELEDLFVSKCESVNQLQARVEQLEAALRSLINASNFEYDTNQYGTASVNKYDLEYLTSWIYKAETVLNGQAATDALGEE